MKTNFFVGIFIAIKTFFSELGKVFSSKEKIIIIALAIIFIASGSILLWDNYVKSTHEVATGGGTYKEGVIAKSSDELTDTINRLTKIGLTKFDDKGNIVPDAALSWEISSDVKQYTFVIKSEYPRDEILNILVKQKDKWPGIQISPKDNDKIIFQFQDSYSPFFSSTTTPVLPYGPYKIESNDGSAITFVTNPDYKGKKPYLDSIVLKIYPDLENLNKAYKSKEIDGVYYTQNPSDFAMSNAYTFNLPRYNMVFFNTSRDVFKDKDIRVKIRNSEKLENELKINMVVLDTPKYHAIADNLAKQWQTQNITPTIYYKNSNDLINNIIPNRDYDVLVYGLNYGADPDPYPFWHSTQATQMGFNLSNYSNIDADVALEDARKTLDPKIRQEKYDTFWKIFNDEVPAIIISQDQWTFAVSNQFKGIATGWSIGPEDRFLKINDWYTKTKRIKN